MASELIKKRNELVPEKFSTTVEAHSALPVPSKSCVLVPRVCKEAGTATSLSTTQLGSLHDAGTPQSGSQTF